MGAADVVGYVTQLGAARKISVAFAPGDTISLNGETWVPSGSGVVEFDCSSWRRRQVMHTRDGAVQVLPADGSLVAGTAGVPVRYRYGSTGAADCDAILITLNAGLAFNVPAGDVGLDVSGCSGVVAFIACQGGVINAGNARWWRRSRGVWHRENNGGQAIQTGVAAVFLRDELVTVGTERLYLELDGAVMSAGTCTIELMGVAR